MQRRIENPVKYLKGSILLKQLTAEPLTIFAKPSIFDVWQGSECASGRVIAEKPKREEVSFLDTCNLIFS